MASPTVASHQLPEYPDSTVPFPDFPGRQSLSPELDRQISELISAMEAAREASDRVRRLFCRSLYPCIKRELGSLREEGPPGDAKVGGENGGEGGGKRASTQDEELGRVERLEGDGENGLDGKFKGSSLILHDNFPGMDKRDKRVTSGWRSKVRIPAVTLAEEEKEGEEEEEDKAEEDMAVEEEEGGEEGKEEERKKEEGRVDARQELDSKVPTNGEFSGVLAPVSPRGAPVIVPEIFVPEALAKEGVSEWAVGRLEGARRSDEPAKRGHGAAGVSEKKGVGAWSVSGSGVPCGKPRVRRDANNSARDVTEVTVNAFPDAELVGAKEKYLQGLDHVQDSQKGSDGMLPEGDSCTPSSATAAAAATMAALERKHGMKGKYKVGEPAACLEVLGKSAGQMKSMGQYRDEIVDRDEAETRMAASVAVIGDLPVASKGAGAGRVIMRRAVGVHAEAKGEGGNGAGVADGAGAVQAAGVAGKDGIGGSARARRSSSTSSSSRSSSGGDGVGSGRVWRGRGDGESSQKQQGGALKQTCLARHFSGGSRQRGNASRRSAVLTSAAGGAGVNYGGSVDAADGGRDAKLGNKSSVYAGSSIRGTVSGEKISWATRTGSAARSASCSFTHGLASLPQAKQQPGRMEEEKQMEQAGNESKQYVQEQEQEREQGKEQELEVLEQNMLWDGDSMDRQNSLQQQEEEEGQKEQQEQGLVRQRQGHQGQVLLDLDGMDEEDGARGALGFVGAAGVRQSSERKKRGANGGATTAEVLDVLPGRPPLPRTAGTAAEVGEKRQGGVKTSRWRCAKTVGSSTVAAAGGTGAAGVGNCDIDLLDSPERAAWDRIAGGGGVGAGANGVRKQGGRRGEGGAKGGSGGGAVGGGVGGGDGSVAAGGGVGGCGDGSGSGGGGDGSGVNKIPGGALPAAAASASAAAAAAAAFPEGTRRTAASIRAAARGEPAPGEAAAAAAGAAAAAAAGAAAAQGPAATAAFNPQEPSRLGRASGPPPPYKYVDVVRKKSDREALQAGECETCRKFYDAILDGDVDGVMVPRCEQHQEASRHRYRFAPPSTPPGFWNVGFDSDL
ncbi:unnamed protein product [Closterium sp. NIES-64]|nr:unnamed protein product [Closterium sp. NIES-64]